MRCKPYIISTQNLWCQIYNPDHNTDHYCQGKYNWIHFQAYQNYFPLLRLKTKTRNWISWIYNFLSYHRISVPKWNTHIQYRNISNMASTNLLHLVSSIFTIKISFGWQTGTSSLFLFFNQEVTFNPIYLKITEKLLQASQN